MIIGLYLSNKDILQELYSKGLSTARNTLKQFENLNRLFNKFESYENKELDEVRNIVWRLCSYQLAERQHYSSEKALGELSNFFNDYQLRIKEKNLQKLEIIECLLKLFKINEIDDDDYRHFRLRLINDDYYQSFSAFTELFMAGIFVSKIGRDNVKLFPSLSNGKKSDILLTIDDKRIYIEIVNLGKRRSEEKIENILTKTAEYIGKKINHNDSWYLRYYVDTAKLKLDKDGNIDEDASIEFLCNEADKLALHKLAGVQNHFYFLGLFHRLLMQETLKKYNSQDQNLINFIEQSKVKGWLNSIDPKYIDWNISTPYTGFCGEPFKSLLVEIHPDGFYPSPASNAERQAFIEQIKRKVENEINEDQIESGYPNIIIVQGEHLSHDDKTEDIYILDKEIKEFLKQRNLSNLSGILFIDNDFFNRRFIVNPYADRSAQLDEKTLEKIGMPIQKIQNGKI